MLNMATKLFCSAVAIFSSCIGPSTAFSSLGTRSGSIASEPPRDIDQYEVYGYTTNAVCTKRNCINPIFPGLGDFPSLVASSWQCQQLENVKDYMRFCKAAVDYDVSLPYLQNSSKTLANLVVQQEERAATTYRYHLAAMNVDAWEYRSPELSGNDCVRALWMLTCNTYFPRSPQGCSGGNGSSYVRPCRNACQNYVESCGVECCDESAKCVARRVPTDPTSIGTALPTRYYDVDGPSAFCTGDGTRLGPNLVAILGLVVTALTSAGDRQEQTEEPRISSVRRSCPIPAFFALAIAALSLQGCDLLNHSYSQYEAWRLKPSYMMSYKHVEISQAERQTGGWQPPASSGVINSCEAASVPQVKKCSGNGVCRAWNPSYVDPIATSVTFCQCYRDWADPECRTRRKSQAKAYFLSLFAGFTGADRFFLGEFYTGLVKLATLGGFGMWWIVDIIYIGCAPPYGKEFRLAADLPHWLFVGSSVSLFAVLGYLLLNIWVGDIEKQRRRASALALEEAACFENRSAPVLLPVKDRIGIPLKSSYSVPAPPGGLYGSATTPEITYVSYGNPYSSYEAYAKMRGQPGFGS